MILKITAEKKEDIDDLWVLLNLQRMYESFRVIVPVGIAEGKYYAEVEVN